MKNANDYRNEITRLENLLNSHNCPMSWNDMNEKIINLKKEHNAFAGFPVWNV